MLYSVELNFLKWKSLLIKGEGGGGRTNSAKKFKNELLVVPKLVTFVACQQ